jgi:PAS domain S-box-containing protein
MEDQERTNEQLVRELERLRQRIAALVTLADETKQADAALQGSLTFSQALIEANPEAMVVIDRDYRIVLANRAAREMAGEEDPASKCLTCYQVFHGGTTPCEELGDRCPLVQITETKAPTTVTHTHHGPHGDEIIVEIRAAPILDASGEVVQIVQTCRDITARKQAEDVLRESEERFHTVVETTEDAVIAIDEDGLVTVFNPAAERMFLRKQEEMMGQAVDHLMPEEYRKRHRKARAAYFAEGKPDSLIGHIVELQALRSDGSVFPIELSLSTGRQHGGERFVLAVIRNITERKRVEQALRLTQFSVDYAGDAVFWLCPDGRFTYANAMACKNLGYSQEELLSMTVHDIDPNFPAQDWPEHWEEIKRRGSFTFESVHRSKDDEEFPVEVSVNYLAFEGREYNCAFARDVTERKQAQESLQRAHDELELQVEQRTAELRRSNRDLAHFAFTASHDLQEPLRMMSTYLRSLQQQYGDSLAEPARDWIELSLECGQWMQRLINDLLSYAHVGTRDERFEALDTNEVVDQVIARLQVTIESNGAAVTRDELPTFTADLTLMTELFQNLISNAIKFHNQELPRVHISAQQSGSEWVFSVRDNGIGIDAKHVDRIFAIFERLHPSDRYAGSGIGLAICKRVVERHGGRIWCESEPGKGTTFFFTVPGMEGSRP